MPRTAAKSEIMHHLETHIKTLRWNSHKMNNCQCTAEGCSAYSQRLATTIWLTTEHPQHRRQSPDLHPSHAAPSRSSPWRPSSDSLSVDLFILDTLHTWKYTRFVQSRSAAHRVRLFATPWTTARQASLSITNSRSSLRLTSIESVMPSSHLILRRHLFSCPYSLPASVSFPMSLIFTWGGLSS